VLKAEAAAEAVTGTKPRATLADVVQHIDHVVAIGGIGAVGLGSDFDGISCAPVALDSVDKWPNLTRALLEEDTPPPKSARFTAKTRCD
jgi:membrane dipeptidase